MARALCKRILVTGIGGPAAASVAESLKKHVHKKYHLVGVDCDAYVGGKLIVDEFNIVPPATDKKFLPSILKLSRKCEALFCTVDEELPIISSSIEKFDCKVFVSPLKAINICLDKFEAFKKLYKAGIPVPETNEFRSRSRNFQIPVIVKPRFGRGSRNVFKITSWKGLETVGFICRGISMITQEYIEGKEYTVDVLANEKSEIVACIPRERIRVRNGLTMVGRTVNNSRLIELAEEIAKAVGLKYIFNFQCRGEKYKVTEVNPRPSGTLILTTEAGINMPKILLEGKLKSRCYINKFKENIWIFRTMNNYYVEQK